MDNSLCNYNADNFLPLTTLEKLEPEEAVKT